MTERDGKMANAKKNDEFWEHMKKDTWPLDDAIEWIKKNLNPEDVFSKSDLDVWAAENDYTKEGRSNG
jgi:hypothetical protein